MPLTTQLSIAGMCLAILVIWCLIGYRKGKHDGVRRTTFEDTQDEGRGIVPIRILTFGTIVGVSVLALGILFFVAKGDTMAISLGVCLILIAPLHRAMTVMGRNSVRVQRGSRACKIRLRLR